MAMTASERVYAIVRAIPRGSIMTYGAIAKKAKTSPRVVGNALHRNPDPKTIPCHRVVNAKGELAHAFAFGGRTGQKKLLEAEGVRVVNRRVDIISI